MPTCGITLVGSSNYFVPSLLHSTNPTRVRRCVWRGGSRSCQTTQADLTFSSSMIQTKVSVTCSPQLVFVGRCSVANHQSHICISVMYIKVLFKLHFAGNVYKFQTGSRFSAIIWHKNLEEASKSSRPQVCSSTLSVSLLDASKLCVKCEANCPGFLFRPRTSIALLKLWQSDPY